MPAPGPVRVEPERTRCTARDPLALLGLNPMPSSTTRTSAASKPGSAPPRGRRASSCRRPACSGSRCRRGSRRTGGATPARQRRCLAIGPTGASGPAPRRAARRTRRPRARGRTSATPTLCSAGRPASDCARRIIAWTASERLATCSAVSPSAFWYSSGLRLCSSVTSSRLRSAFSGVRSSCAAFAEKRCMRSTLWRMRSIISFSVVASSSSSSPGAGRRQLLVEVRAGDAPRRARDRRRSAGGCRARASVPRAGVADHRERRVQN